MRDNHTFHIYVNREAIGYGVLEEYHLSGGWVRTSSHAFFQEALAEKDRTVAKGLDCLLVNTSLEGWPTRTLYTSNGEFRRVEHPKTAKELARKIAGMAL